MSRLIVAVILLCSGCASTVVPNRVESKQIAFDAGVQNAGVLAILPDGSAILTEAKYAEWIALVSLYGRGTQDSPILPSVTKDAGIIPKTGVEVGFPTYAKVYQMDAQRLTYFIAFRAWERAARIPAK